MVTKLDTRPARCDLTSRECAKLLCGIAAGALVHHSVEAVRLTLGFTVASILVLDDEATMARIRSLHCPKGDVLTEAAATLWGAAMGAIAEQAAPGALRTAWEWMHDRDDVWIELQRQARVGTALQDPP